MRRINFLCPAASAAFFYWTTWLCTIAACAQSAKEATDDLTPKLRDGDLIFQISKSAQGKAIQNASGSEYTHMGIIFLNPDGTALVFEAIQPVKTTPLMAWIRRGKGSHYLVKRVRESSSRLTPPKLAKMRREATRLLGTDYDPLFEWSDNRLYCSEYVWKIYKRAADIEIGKPQPWSALALDSPAVRRLVSDTSRIRVHGSSRQYVC